MEPIQELALINANGPFQIARRESRVELGDVAPDELGREHEVSCAGDGVVVPDLVAERVERLVQPLSRLFLIRVEPQKPDEPVPGYATATGRSDDGE